MENLGRNSLCNLSVGIFKAFSFVLFLFLVNTVFSQLNYRIVETMQTKYYDTTSEISTPLASSIFYGQDACYSGNLTSYTNNNDGTITDNITGLMWSKTPDLDNDGDIDADDKLSYYEALLSSDTLSLAGYSDWRIPSIKEIYSLIIFSGIDPSGYEGTSTSGLIPFIDTNYFEFGYGDINAGERIIDAQMASSTKYVHTTMNGDSTMFGVNFADGRIKGYGTGPLPGQTLDKQFYVFFVRGNSNYGINDFVDNQDSTISDNATGLMWTKYDSEQSLVWTDALAFAENSNIAGYSDWRLPNAKELQSIVDYSRSPATTNSAAIDPVFHCSTISDEGGSTNYPFYWTGTTHANWTTNNQGQAAAYVCFGEALGWMEQPPLSGNYTLMDVHGAGAQRSDPKTGNPADYPYGNGPQGDVIRIYNYVRLVRDFSPTSVDVNIYNSDLDIEIFPNPAKSIVNIQITSEINSKADVKIYNILGSEILSQKVETSKIIKVDLSEFPKGSYIFKIVFGDNVTTRTIYLS